MAHPLTGKIPTYSRLPCDLPSTHTSAGIASALVANATVTLSFDWCPHIDVRQTIKGLNFGDWSVWDRWMNKKDIVFTFWGFQSRRSYESMCKGPYCKETLM
jgi:hypothetical protein